jgi:hypothetical protein
VGNSSDDAASARRIWVIGLARPPSRDVEMSGNEMTKEWTPSWLGRRLTGSPEWRLLRTGFELSLTAAGRSHCINVEDETSYRVQRGYCWLDRAKMRSLPDRTYLNEVEHSERNASIDNIAGIGNDLALNLGNY